MKQKIEMHITKNLADTNFNFLNNKLKKQQIY